MSSEKICRLLLTGQPGVGKTTLVKEICRRLVQDHKLIVRGFYTEEVRDARTRHRIGFDIVDLHTGRRTELARATSAATGGGPTVGKYSVSIDRFQSMAIDCLKVDETTRVLAIDEIGKMETFSRQFCDCIESMFGSAAQRSNLLILATVPSDPGRRLSLVNRIKQSERSQLITVTVDNRNQLLDELTERIVAFCR